MKSEVISYDQCHVRVAHIGDGGNQLNRESDVVAVESCVGCEAALLAEVIAMGWTRDGDSILAIGVKERTDLMMVVVMMMMMMTMMMMKDAG